jgi:hypothetical protein
MVWKEWGPLCAVLEWAQGVIDSIPLDVRGKVRDVECVLWSELEGSADQLVDIVERVSPGKGELCSAALTEGEAITSSSAATHERLRRAARAWRCSVSFRQD